MIWWGVLGSTTHMARGKKACVRCRYKNHVRKAYCGWCGWQDKREPSETEMMWRTSAAAGVSERTRRRMLANYAARREKARKKALEVERQWYMKGEAVYASSTEEDVEEEEIGEDEDE